MAKNKFQSGLEESTSTTPSPGIVASIAKTTMAAPKANNDANATFRIDRDLLHEFKVYAANHGFKQKDILAAALIAYMEANP